MGAFGASGLVTELRALQRWRCRVDIFEGLRKAAGTFFACDHPQWYASVNVPGELDMTIDSFRSELTFSINDSVVMEHRIARSQEKRYQAYDGDGGFFADPDHPAYGINRLCCGGGLLIRDAQAIVDAGFAPYALMPFEDLQLTTRWSDYESWVSELQFKSQGEGPLTGLPARSISRSKMPSVSMSKFPGVVARRARLGSRLFSPTAKSNLRRSLVRSTTRYRIERTSLRGTATRGTRRATRVARTTYRLATG